MEQLINLTDLNNSQQKRQDDSKRSRPFQSLSPVNLQRVTTPSVSTPITMLPIKEGVESDCNIVQSDEMPGAYLGATVLNRADILDFDGSSQPLPWEELEFVLHFTHSPIGQQLARARLVKRWFAGPIRIYRPPQADMVPKRYNPEDDVILPLYGDSKDDLEHSDISDESQQGDEAEESDETDNWEEGENGI